MALTREFKATVAARASRDPAFREALLREAIEALLAGVLLDPEVVAGVLAAESTALLEAFFAGQRGGPDG